MLRGYHEVSPLALVNPNEEEAEQTFAVSVGAIATQVIRSLSEHVHPRSNLMAGNDVPPERESLAGHELEVGL